VPDGLRARWPRIIQRAGGLAVYAGRLVAKVEEMGVKVEEMGVGFSSNTVYVLLF